MTFANALTPEQSQKLSNLSISDVISEMESSNNTFAMRFEPAVFADVSKSSKIIADIMEANKCDVETAAVIYSTSWGLYQIMGFNIYRQLQKFRIGQYLASRRLQEGMFLNFLISHDLFKFTVTELFNNPQSLNHFASIYNGPKDAEQYGAYFIRTVKNLCGIQQ